MAHPNARLTPVTRLELVREIEVGYSQAEVARRFRVSRATVGSGCGGRLLRSRVWQVMENTDLELADASDRIQEHRERQLEVAADEARAMLAERHVLLDSAETVAAFAEEMSGFLRTSDITETRAFVRSS